MRPAPNYRLFHIVAAVAASARSGMPLTYSSGLEPLDVEHFLAVAAEAGLVAPYPEEWETDARWGVTEKGENWSREVMRWYNALADQCNGIKAAAPTAPENSGGMMPGLKHIDAYHRNTIEGVPMRKIAAERNQHASTVMRQIRTIETVRDLPEWEEILMLLGKVTGSRKGAAVAIEDLEKALGVTEQQAEAELAAQSRLVKSPDTSLQMAKSGPGGLFYKGEVRGIVHRPLALMWIALGWMDTDREVVEGRARRYHLTPTAPELGDTASPRTPGLVQMTGAKIPFDTIIRRLPAELIPALKKWRLIWDLRNGAGRDEVDRAREVLHPMVFEALVEVGCEGGHVESFEKRHKVPARSGKLLVRLALEQLESKQADDKDSTEPKIGRQLQQTAKAVLQNNEAEQDDDEKGEEFHGEASILAAE